MPPNQNQFPAPNSPVPPQRPDPPLQPPQQSSPVQSLPPQPQLTAQPQQTDQTPYDFFLDPKKTEKPGPFAGVTGVKKLLLFGGAAAIGLMIIAVMASFIFGGKSEPLALLTVAQTQQELIRIAADGTKNTKTTKLQNFSVTTGVSVTSAQKAVLAELAKKGVKPKTKVLEATKKATTDQALQAALAANTYDTTFETTMQTELDNYHTRLEDAAAAASSKSERDLMLKQITDTELLQKQLLSK